MQCKSLGRSWKTLHSKEQYQTHPNTFGKYFTDASAASAAAFDHSETQLISAAHGSTTIKSKKSLFNGNNPFDLIPPSETAPFCIQKIPKRLINGW